MRSRAVGQEGLQPFSVSFLVPRMGHFLYLTQKFLLDESLGPCARPVSGPRLVPTL